MAFDYSMSEQVENLRPKPRRRPRLVSSSTRITSVGGVETLVSQSLRRLGASRIKLFLDSNRPWAVARMTALGLLAREAQESAFGNAKLVL